MRRPISMPAIRSQLGRQYRELRGRMKQFTVLGGCCGTDHRHVEQICFACTAEVSGGRLLSGRAGKALGRRVSDGGKRARRILFWWARRAAASPTSRFRAGAFAHPTDPSL